MTRVGILLAHVLAGTFGLLLGQVVLLTQGRRRDMAARGYQVAVWGVAVSGALLAATAFARLWWLLPVAGGTLAALLLGVRAWRRRAPGWEAASAHLLGGSYVALVTGVLIAGTGNPVYWILPALIAQWPIAVAKRRLATVPRHSQI